MPFRSRSISLFVIILGLGACGGGGSGGSDSDQEHVLRDTTAPSLDLPPNITVTALNAEGTPASDQSISDFLQSSIAIDDIDGQVSVANDAPEVFPLGTTVVIFTARDSAGNVAQGSATVKVSDLSVPVISLLGENPTVVIVGNEYNDAGVVASDNVDGEITSEVIRSGTVNTSIPGVYLQTYNVSDVAGNNAEEVIREIFVRAVNETSTLNDTGVTFSGALPWGNNSECEGELVAQQDCFHGRDATHFDDSDGHAGFSFTKLDFDGNDLPNDAQEWSCVRDNVTGLVWEIKTRDGGIHDVRNQQFRWGGKTAMGSDYGESFDDWNVLVDGSNEEELCGFSDWRVPTIDELIGLVDYSRTYPAIDTNYFPDAEGTVPYWSATRSAERTNNSWYVAFHLGVSYFGGTRNNYRRVRLVR